MGNHPSTGGTNDNDDKDRIRLEGRYALLVAVVTGLVTASVGVGLSQWIEGCSKASDAENAARVLEQTFRAAEDALDRSLKDGRYRSMTSRSNFPSMSRSGSRANSTSGTSGSQKPLLHSVSRLPGRERSTHLFRTTTSNSHAPRCEWPVGGESSVC